MTCRLFANFVLAVLPKMSCDTLLLTVSIFMRLVLFCFVACSLVKVPCGILVDNFLYSEVYSIRITF